MSESLHGLGCPRCGGMVPVPEGQVIVVCPYCGARSVVSSSSSTPSILVDGKTEAESVSPIGAAGMIAPTSGSVDSKSSSGGRIADLSMRAIRRYQAPIRIDRDTAIQSLRGFFSGKFQIARDCAKQAQLTETLLVHLPFWAVWARGVAWAFGQQQVGSGDNKRYEPREKRAATELVWNAPACEVGEFGVQRVSLDDCPLEPFNPAALHRTGMVFEPVGSAANALESAREHFEAEIRSKVDMSRTEQIFTRLIHTRLGLVYYPLWVMRYLYRGRAFQVVVNAYDGSVLYGKAPGSVGYRAGVLVGGMALGSILTVDVPYAIMVLASGDEDSPFLIALGAFLFGLATMYGAYRTFRHGEHYEYHRFKPLGKKNAGITGMLPGNLQLATGDLQKALRQIEKMK